MGSFYNRGHSGVVLNDEECILFFVVQNSEDDEVYGLYKPISGPIACTYADYGTYDLMDGGQEVFNDFLEFIKPRLKTCELGENEYHDIPANPDLLTWEYVHNLCRENRFFGEEKSYNSSEKTAFRIQRFVVHKYYYDKIILDYSGSSAEKLSSTNIYLDIKNNFEKDLEKSKVNRWFSIGQSLEMRTRHLDSQSYRLTYYRNLFEDFLKKNKIEEYQLNYIVSAILFMNFMRGGNFDFFPSNYASQNSSEVQLLLHSNLLKDVLLNRYTDSDNLCNLLSWYDDFSETEIDTLYERLMALPKDELMKDEEFIMLVLNKENRKRS